MTRFTVNGVTYTAKPFDFNMVCELEDMGVTFERIDKMPMSLIRAYFSICAGVSTEQGAQFLQTHLMNGGKLDDITEPMAKEMNSSDFFRAISQNPEKKTPTSTQDRQKKTDTGE